MKDFNRALWERVDEHREFIRKEAGNYPMIDDFEAAYQAACGTEAVDEIIDRTKRISKNPFAAVMFYIEMGSYPPPEFLLTLLDCWKEYLVKGDLELAFLGPKKQKSGNFAKRHQKFMRDNWILSQAVYLIDIEGMTLAQAAERIHTNLTEKSVAPVAAPNHWASVNVPKDADSIERILHGKFNRKKAGGK